MDNFNIELSPAELLIVEEVLVRAKNSLEFNQTDQIYRNGERFYLSLREKEEEALRSAITKF